LCALSIAAKVFALPSSELSDDGVTHSIPYNWPRVIVVILFPQFVADSAALGNLAV